MELELLTAAELALRLKVCERTVLRMVADGRIPAKKVLAKTRFYWPDVVAALPATPSAVAFVPVYPGYDLVARLKSQVKAANQLERERRKQITQDRRQPLETEEHGSSTRDL